MNDLLDDPRPNMSDSWQWEKLFRLTCTLHNKQTGYELLRRLWTVRSAGALIRNKDGVNRLEPILPPAGEWGKAEFEEMKKRYLSPYRTEIQYLLSKL
ncbi:hypothetical protein [Paenibacillus sp. MBLB4367]|uniref:hypothetical protein n=1 Tax=Paenibacillus sp. MBLB4367 TaxID=3384767 RepID=UPI00390826AC